MYPYSNVTYAVFLCFAQLMASLCIGHWLYRKIFEANLKNNPLVSLSLSLLIGNAASATIFQWTAFTGVFYPIVNASLLIAMVLLGGRQTALTLIRSICFLVKMLRDIWSENCFCRVLAGLLISLLIVNLLTILKPLYFDALAYYFAQPKLIAISHNFKLLNEFNNLNHFSLLFDMVVAAFFSLGKDPIGRYAAQMQPFYLMLAGLILFYAACRKLGLSKSASLISLLMLVGSKMFSIYIGTGKSEPVGISYYLAAIFALVNLGSDKGWAILLGLFCGLSVLAKMSTAYFILPGVTCFVLLIFWGEWKILIKQIWEISVGGMLCVLLLLIQNAVLHGEPLSPIYSFAKNQFFPSAMLANTRFITSEIATKIWSLFPISVTLGRYPGDGSRASALWLALLPLMFFIPWPKWKQILRNRIFAVFLSGTTGLILWQLLFPTCFMSRLFNFSLIMLIPLPAYGWMYIEKQFRHECFQNTIKVFIVIITLSITYSTYHNNQIQIQGSSNIPFYKLAEIVNADKRQDIVVLNIMWAQALFRNDITKNILYLQDVARHRQNKNPKNNFWEPVAHLGVDYVFIFLSSRRNYIKLFFNDFLPPKDMKIYRIVTKPGLLDRHEIKSFFTDKKLDHQDRFLFLKLEYDKKLYQ